MDSSSWPVVGLPADRKKMIEELNRGREFANKLKDMLTEPIKDDGSMSAGDIVKKILGSFTETLSILNCAASDEISQIPANTRLSSPCRDGRKSEDSGDSSKTSALKDRRGCYKRRKTSQTWSTVTATLIDDGHAWRKYGQKTILNASHPRNYYRCTHKFDQGCLATKQVQRTEDDPCIMYRITYNGQHTCKNLLKSSQIILDSTPDHHQSSFLLSFGSNYPNNKPISDQYPFFESLPSIKQEFNNEKMPSHDHLNPNHSSSSTDYFVSPFESCGPITGSDHGDVISSGVYSCTASTHSNLDMDIMVGSDFDDVLEYEF